MTAYIQEVVVYAPEGPVTLELHRSPTGGYFCVEAEFLDQVSEEVYDPYGAGEKVLLQSPEGKPSEKGVTK